jgi:hypothetical protein
MNPQLKVQVDTKKKNSKMIMVNGVALEMSVQGLLEQSEFKINFDLEREVLAKYYNQQRK